MIMTALCVAFWATFLLVLVDHVSKQCLLYAVGCTIPQYSFISWILLVCTAKLLPTVFVHFVDTTNVYHHYHI
jgi:hypothetical protein